MKDYLAKENLLKGRVILVTGAGGAIGSAAAKCFAAHGATVILHGKNQQKIERIYDEIEAAGGPKPALYPLDLELAGPEQYAQMVEIIDKEFGVLDGLLHNAGFLKSLTQIEHHDAGLWQKIMQINLNAPFMLSQACLPLLKKSKDASVIFTSSRVAQQGRAYWGAYAASKAGQDNLMQTLADELETNTNIRVNSIDPGAVRTAMRARAYPGENPNTLPYATDIMASYLYLVGPDSKGETGKIFTAY